MWIAIAVFGALAAVLLLVGVLQRVNAGPRTRRKDGNDGGDAVLLGGVGGGGDSGRGRHHDNDHGQDGADSGSDSGGGGDGGGGGGD